MILQKTGPAGFQSSLGQKLIKNTAFNFLGQFYGLVLGFAVVPYLVHRLGVEAYGVFALAAALGGFAGLLNLGVGKALSKRVAELYWKGDWEPICKLFQTALMVCLGAGGAAALLFFGFEDRISSELFHTSGDHRHLVSFALYATGLSVLVSLLFDLLSGLITALQRFDVYNRINVVVASVTYLGSVLAVATGFSLKGVLVVIVAANLVGVAGCVRFLRQALPVLPLRPKFHWPAFCQLASFSLFVLVAGSCAVLVHRLDRMLVGYYLPLAAVALYTIPYSLAEKTTLAVGNLTSVIFPSASELSSMPGAEKLKELYLRASKMVLLAALPWILVLLFLASPLLRFWMGQQFAEQGTVALQLLTLGFFLNILGHVPFTIAQGAGWPSLSAKFSILNAVVALLLFRLLIPRYGIDGAAAAFLISEMLVMPLFVHSVNRHLGVGWKSLLLRAYLPAAVCGTVASSVLVVLGSRVSSVAGLFAAVGLALIFYATVVLVCGLDSQERAQIQLHLSVFWKPAVEREIGAARP